MTALDPTHFPLLAHTSNPRTGQAVHTSVAAPNANDLPDDFANLRGWKTGKQSARATSKSRRRASERQRNVSS